MARIDTIVEWDYRVSASDGKQGGSVIRYVLQLLQGGRGIYYLG